MALFMRTGLRISASLWTPQAQQQVKPSSGKVPYISEASYIFNTVTEELSSGPRLSVGHKKLDTVTERRSWDAANSELGVCLRR